MPGLPSTQTAAPADSGPRTRAGAPSAITSSGITAFGGTRLPAPISVRRPIRAPSCTVLPLPISASAAMTAPWTTQVCPTVAPGPISVSGSFPPCSTELSWMLAPARIQIRPKSARSTTPYQTEAPASTTTSPTTVAVGAIQASGWTCGARPSKENSGMPGTLGSAGRPLRPQGLLDQSRRRGVEHREDRLGQPPGTGRVELHRDPRGRAPVGVAEVDVERVVHRRVERVVQVHGGGREREPPGRALPRSGHRHVRGLVGAHPPAPSAQVPAVEVPDPPPPVLGRLGPVGGPVGGEEGVPRALVGVELVLLAGLGQGLL